MSGLQVIGGLLLAVCVGLLCRRCYLFGYEDGGEWALRELKGGFDEKLERIRLEYSGKLRALQREGEALLRRVEAHERGAPSLSPPEKRP